MYLRGPDSEVFKDLVCGKAQALDRCEVAIGGFGPLERIWVAVSGIDIGGSGFEFGCGAMDAANEAIDWIPILTRARDTL